MIEYEVTLACDGHNCGERTRCVVQERAPRGIEYSTPAGWEMDNMHKLVPVVRCPTCSMLKESLHRLGKLGGENYGTPLRTLDPVYESPDARKLAVYDDNGQSRLTSCSVDDLRYHAIICPGDLEE